MQPFPLTLQRQKNKSYEAYGTETVETRKNTPSSPSHTSFVGSIRLLWGRHCIEIGETALFDIDCVCSILCMLQNTFYVHWAGWGVTVEMWTWCNHKNMHVIINMYVIIKYDVTVQWQLGNISHNSCGFRFMYKHWAGLILVESRMHVPTTCPTNWLCVIACAGWWCGGKIVYMFVLCTCFSCDVSCSDVWSSCICRHNHKHDLKMLAPHQVYPALYSWLDLHFKVLVFDKQHEYKTTDTV